MHDFTEIELKDIYDAFETELFMCGGTMCGSHPTVFAEHVLSYLQEDGLTIARNHDPTTHLLVERDGLRERIVGAVNARLGLPDMPDGEWDDVTDAVMAAIDPTAGAGREETHKRPLDTTPTA